MVGGLVQPVVIRFLFSCTSIEYFTKIKCYLDIYEEGVYKYTYGQPNNNQDFEE